MDWHKNCFYRVSLKAIIRNDKNEVLVVKEKGSDWSLPGGGMDHGESAHDALKRELYEEVLLEADFTEKAIDIETMWLETKQAWLMWIVFEVVPEMYEFGIGDDGDEMAFIDPARFKDSDARSERLVYRFCVDKRANV